MFGWHKKESGSCPVCSYHIVAFGEPRCTKNTLNKIDVRQLTAEGIGRQTSELPPENTCSGFQPLKQRR